jgi:nucleotide-binding universal stress UspA family protein
MMPTIKKILFVSDLSENSIPALQWAIMLAHRHDARITFLHVIEDVLPQATLAVRSFMGEEKWKEMSADHHADFNVRIKERIAGFCETVVNQMSSCPLVVTDIVIDRGVPVEVILETAASNDHDLIAMGAHGTGAFKGAMIGSTAKHVVRRSKLPVFVIPLAGKKKQSLIMPEPLGIE